MSGVPNSLFFKQDNTSSSLPAIDAMHEMIARYPYCQNIRIMILLKSLEEGISDTGKLLQITATYSTDRPFLYHLVQSVEKSNAQEAILRAEEYFELSDLTDEPVKVPVVKANEVTTDENNQHSDIIFQEASRTYTDIEANENTSEVISESLPEYTLSVPDTTPAEILDLTSSALTVPTADDEPIPQSVETETPTPTEIDEESGLMHQLVHLLHEPVVALEKVISLEELFAGIEDEDVVDQSVDSDFDNPLASDEHLDSGNAQVIEFEVAAVNTPAEAVEIEPKTSATSFTAWLKNKKRMSSGYQTRLAVDYGDITVKADENRRKDKKGYGLVADVVEKSVAESEDIVSETLANILALQGKKDKAISMFERLNLLYPEKSAYFAEKITKIKNS